MTERVAGICWPHDGTVGRITVADNLIEGNFPAAHGGDATVLCDMVDAGKYRNGKPRKWCRAHQRYWGVMADLAALAASAVPRCASHAAPMGYAVNPPLIDMRLYANVALGLTSRGVALDAQAQSDAAPPLLGVFPALALAFDPQAPLFGDAAITQVNVTPPALRALKAAMQSGKTIGCVNCARCGHPHLDLGSFATTAHRRHYCGNCGHDGTHSAHDIISNPLFALSLAYGARLHIADSCVHGHTVL